jgi:hypothetical protein
LFRIGTLLAVILACISGAAAQGSDTSPPTEAGVAGVTEIYLAKDDGSGQAGDAATSFVTTDVPIYCVVVLDSAIPVTVRMNLVAVSVGGVKAGTRVVSTSYTTRENENRVNFSGRPAGQWVPGIYRVDIFLDDLQVHRREFTVQKAATAKPASKPQNTRSADKSKYSGRVKKP